MENKKIKIKYPKCAICREIKDIFTKFYVCNNCGKIICNKCKKKDKCEYCIDGTLIENKLITNLNNTLKSFCEKHEKIKDLFCVNCKQKKCIFCLGLSESFNNENNDCLKEGHFIIEFEKYSQYSSIIKEINEILNEFSYESFQNYINEDKEDINKNKEDELTKEFYNIFHKKIFCDFDCKTVNPMKRLNELMEVIYKGTIDNDTVNPMKRLNELMEIIYKRGDKDIVKKRVIKIDEPYEQLFKPEYITYTFTLNNLHSINIEDKVKEQKNEIEKFDFNLEELENLNMSVFQTVYYSDWALFIEKIDENHPLNVYALKKSKKKIIEYDITFEIEYFDDKNNTVKISKKLLNVCQNESDDYLLIKCENFCDYKKEKKYDEFVLFCYIRPHTLKDLYQEFIEKKLPYS